jgi:tetratricopeptide (TPR) repeat protein
VDHYPESLTALSSLYEALYETENVEEAFEILDKMIEIDPEPDENIADKANSITDKMILYYYPLDEYYELLDAIDALEFEEQMTQIELYVEHNPNDLMAAYVLSDYYFELGEYEKIESVLEPLVIQYPDWKMGLYTLIPVKRDLMKSDEARQYYNALIGLNKENAFSYMIASKAELKFKDDAKALELAVKAYEYAPENPYVHGTLAMAYHFNSNDEMSTYFLDLFNDSEYVDEATYEFVNLMVTNQSDWR